MDNVRIAINDMIDGTEARLQKNSMNEEVWIVQEFLSVHDVIFKESDISPQPQDSKIDIIFKCCNFQIKKILYPSDYKPNAEDKIFLQDLKKCQTKKDFINATVSNVTDHPGWHKPCVLRNLIIEKAKYWSTKIQNNKVKYEDDVRADLDLLFYIEPDLTKKRLTAFSFDHEISRILCVLGWRSVSYVYGSKSLVLYVAENAPTFLKEIYNNQI